MDRFRLAVAIVLALAGLVWFGQGTGLVGGSPMSSQSIWALIGAASSSLRPRWPGPRDALPVNSPHHCA